MRPLRKIVAGTAAAALLPVVWLGAAAPAEAATTCKGKVIGTYKHYEPKGTPERLVGTTTLYWDGANNCAKTEKYLERGTPTEMLTKIIRKSDRGFREDHGFNYKYYAGPVVLPAKKDCIRLEILIMSSVGYPHFQGKVPADGSWMKCS